MRAPEPVRMPEPTVAAPQPAAPRGEPSAPDETAQWWLAAWARWSGWKNTLAFPEAVREELSKYPYPLSGPIQQSPDFEEGPLGDGYSIHIGPGGKQGPGGGGH